MSIVSTNDAGWLSRWRGWQRRILDLAKLWLLRRYAYVASVLLAARYRLAAMCARNSTIVVALVLFTLMTVSFLGIEYVQVFLSPQFATDNRLSDLRAVFVQAGGALAGAAAIVSSLVLFAVQVNIERMPHGLFRRLGSDVRLLLAFATAFVLAIAVSCMSLVTEPSRIGLVVVLGLWAFGLVLVLFLYAYVRALRLVNPLHQLQILVDRTRSNLNAWRRRGDRLKPLLSNATDVSSTHDFPLLTFLQLNRHWHSGAEVALRHAMSYAKRYSEFGDHEVSAAALNAVIALNRAYVGAKGKTFFANVPLLDNPLSTDGFINTTLEHLRQHVRAGVTRGDEEQLEQSFRAIAALANLYMTIDYSDELASKTHAQLASGYLTEAVISVVPHEMPDVLIEGVRQIGKTAELFISVGHPDDIAVLSEKLMAIGATGVARQDYRPVTQFCVDHLASLTCQLLRLPRHDIRFIARELRQDILVLTKLMLTVPETPLQRVHGTCLGPYYSLVSNGGLMDNLTALANGVAKAERNDTPAQTVARNIEEWSNQIYESAKETLLEAVKVKSFFTRDVILWIAHVTEVLLVVAAAPAASAFAKDLERNAHWLISVLTWLPSDPESLAFVERFQYTERLFESGERAHDLGFPKVAMTISDMLLAWTFRAGKRERGWGTMERGLLGAAVLALLRGGDAVQELHDGIDKHLGQELPENDLRARVAGQLFEIAEDPNNHRGHWSSRIDNGFGKCDKQELKPVLERITQQLAPVVASPP